MDSTRLIIKAENNAKKRRNEKSTIQLVLKTEVEGNVKNNSSMTDSFGLEVEGFSESNLPKKNIKALERHYEIIYGLSNETMSMLERKIHEEKNKL